MDETGILMMGAAEAIPTPGRRRVYTTFSNPTNNAIVLDHHIFDSSEGWRKAESMQHPILKLRLTVDNADYKHVGVKSPNVKPSYVDTVADTGAHSCLWGLQVFSRHGFKKSHLLPVSREEIEISGADFIRLTRSDEKGMTYTAPVMV